MSTSALLVAFMLGAAPTPTGTPAPPQALLAGCYHLVFGPWQPSIVDSRWQSPPTHVRFHREAHPTPFRPGAFRVSFPRVAAPVPWSAEWKPDDARTFSIVFVAQHSGISMRLTATDNRLSGTARTFGEVYPKRSTASVSASRESCAP